MLKGDFIDWVVNEFCSVGVDVFYICMKFEGCVVLYFMEFGEYLMFVCVFYDWEYILFCDVIVEDFDWEVLFDICLVFVIGIIVVLIENIVVVVCYFVDEVYCCGIVVVFDVNYWFLLWGLEYVCEVLELIVRMLNIVFCLVCDGKVVFGIEFDGEQVCCELCELFGVLMVVFID